jgi:predicted RNase H-like nuclease (RuvC/YqgF family)
MTDLVKRLRDLGDHASFEPHMHHTAADRIEELEAESESALTIIAAQRAEVLKLREERHALLAEVELLKKKEVEEVMWREHHIEELKAERDALKAENQRLRECLEEAQNAPEPDHHCPPFRHVMDIVGAALAQTEGEK